jgi:rSAM/selenodomain-associated transferase 1
VRAREDDVHVTVIAKTPVPGRVKTRLCPPCTPAQAAGLAKAALLDTFEALRRATSKRNVRRVLLLDGAIPEWAPRDFDVVAQCNGDLGDRLAHGFETLGPGVIVGMETPHACTDLESMFAALDRGDDALGPALDGGYWSIGLARVDRRAFEGVAWSTSTTFADQQRRLVELERTVAVVHAARDIDTFDDVRALAGSGGWGRAVRCAAALVAAVDDVRLAIR